MKRSEMVNEIAKVIAGFKGSTEPTQNDMYVASSILSKTEELGMQSPRLTGIVDSITIVSKLGPGRVYVCNGGWEDEA